MKKPTRVNIFVIISLVLIVAAIYIVTPWIQSDSEINQTAVDGTNLVISRWPMDTRIDHSAEFGAGFTLRNTYGTTLYYNWGYYRLYLQYAGIWQLIHTQTGGASSHIKPHVARSYRINWEDQKPTGQYRLARDFYLSQSDTTPHKTIYIEFEIIPFEDLLLQMIEHGDILQQLRENSVSFVVAGTPSEFIIQEGEVLVSRTSIAFYYHNPTNKTFIYGSHWELAHYVEGKWQPVPFAFSGLFGGQLIPLSIEGGQTKFDVINFGYRFGELPPGRYMFIRSHSLITPGLLPWDLEYMLFEFIVDENTPYALDIKQPHLW